MKQLLTFLIILFLSYTSGFAQQKTVQVLDRQSRMPIINAHILSQDGTPITATNVDGYFTVNLQKTDTVTVHSLGYMKHSVILSRHTGPIYLRAAVVQMGTELIVQDTREKSNDVHAYHTKQSHQDMDDFLADIDGIAMVQRGAFAWEPIIRGQGDQRMNLTIDGMQVFKACVDKMDPITSYVESNNLAKLEVDKSGSGVAEFGNGNSTINLITQKAENNRFMLDAETAYRMPDNYQNYRLNLNTADASGRNTFRFSGSFKQAGNMQAGGAETIDNTQYEKMNLNGFYEHSFSSGHSIEVNYITDKAFDVGYPALLMDATKALADIGRIQFNFAESGRSSRLKSVMVYANMIRHSMDDYSRDVANRPVMRGMYMPMYGETTTFGTKIHGETRLSSQPLHWFLEGFTSEAFGDMHMISLDPNVSDMLIYNLDEVYTHNLGIGFRHHVQLSNALLLNFEQSSRFKTLGTNSASHATFFEGLYNKELPNRARILLSGSANMLWMMNDNWSLSNSLVYSERMGNHMELFGHYIYNYTDGYFYDGNPWLDVERTLNVDVNTSWKTEQHAFSLSLFYKYYFNYIDGVISTDVSNNNFKFKRNANVGDAIMTGAELRTIHNFNKTLHFENRLSYVYAQNITIDEPLPLIPPLKGTSSLNYHLKQNEFSLQANWAAPQNRIAETASIETKTDAYFTLDLGYERSWMSDRLVTSLQLKNLTDRYYSTHTSIGDIPEAGFSVLFSMSVHL